MILSTLGKSSIILNGGEVVVKRWKIRISASGACEVVNPNPHAVTVAFLFGGVDKPADRNDVLQALKFAKKHL